jgi:arginyl-tRNA synthetase
MLKKDIEKKITELFKETLAVYFQENHPNLAIPDNLDIVLQTAKDKKHGDLTSNIAMRLASCVKLSPIEISRDLASRLNKTLESGGVTEYIGKVESMGGFINFWLSGEYYCAVLADIVAKGKEFGKTDIGAGKHINIEFVSANPTGPLTIAHGRQAAIGDALARILRHCGYRVTSEYYLNDYGRQINLLGKSVEARYRNLFGKEEELPEDGYMGDYIVDIAEEIKQKEKDSRLEKSKDTDKFFRDYAINYMMDLIKIDLEDFRVSFDVWTSQAGIEGRDEVQTILKKLKDGGYVYDKDGATWLASTQYGDDKDRVVVKSDGSFTYLAPDIAYHNNKFERGFDRLIDLLGPDHHGYIKRMKAAVQALGHGVDSLDILIVQLVTLLRGGECVSMSTRKGEFISLREILDEIGTDVTRFFFLMRKLDSHLDFDIEVAKQESSDNPVFYIQYAHARICSIFKVNRENDNSVAFEDADVALLTDIPGKELIRKLADFSMAVEQSAESLEPSRLITYLNELAREFHSFYTECRVLTDDIEKTKARLFLVQCVKIVLATGLDLLNITFPEKM